MKDKSTTKQELLKDISSLKKRIHNLELAELEHKLAQEALQESEAEKRWLLDSMTNAFVLFGSVFDEQGKFVSYRFQYINKAYERITGVRNEEVKGKTVHEVWPETEHDWIENYGEVAVTGITKTFTMYHNPTKKLYSCCVYRPWDTTERFCVVFEDVTEIKRAEEKLRESEELFRSYLEYAPDGVYMSDVNGNFLYGNRKCEEIIGYRREELIGKNFLELNILPEKSLNKAAQLLQANIEGKSTGPDEIELISKEGRLVPVEINTSVFQRIGQKIILAFVRDITDRKQAEEALLESEEKCRLVVENAAEVILIAQDGLLKYVNPMAVKILGYSEEVLTTRPFVELLHPEDIQKVVEAHMSVMRGEENQPVRQFRVIPLDGNVRWVDSRAVVISYEGKPATVNFIIDITERKKAEKALQESEERYRSFVENA
ncbi:MAG: PAS domain S-box protein, partial [Desulfobacterales bacterium]